MIYFALVLLKTAIYIVISRISSYNRKMLNEFDVDDIYIRHAIDEKPYTSEYAMHIHSRCEIYFFVSGKVEYLVEGSCYPLEENNIMIMRPSESHAARILQNERYERFALNFPLNFLDDFDPSRILMKPFLERDLGKENLFTENEIDVRLARTLFSRMTDMNILKNDYSRRLAIKTNLPPLLYMIHQGFSERGQRTIKTPTFTEKVIRYINNHLFEELTVTDLAEHFNLSTSQFTRVFRQNTGSSPWEYILRKRLTAARTLLHNGISTQKASEDCGFSDYSSFYRAYIKYFHESPGASRGKR